jgi:ABC-type antimicrobial peptide transport system permease subunit
VRKRPGPLWLLFYGRQRRGVPWLLIGVIVGVLLLALTFALPGAADMWRSVAPVILGVSLLVAIVAAIAAMLRPRRR